jgi:hypothetical protein
MSPWTRRAILLIGVGILHCSGPQEPEASRTWRLTPDGGADSLTIQAAIDAAADGDTILLAAGTYTGAGNRDIEFHGKALVLIGIAGPESTILDCQGVEGEPHRGFHFHEGEGAGSRIAGLTITNGFAEGRYPACYGGAILCIGSSPTIEDCWLVRNRSDHFGGGMVCFENASPVLNRVRFISNTAVNNGGGFGSKMHSQPTLTDVLFAGNSAKRGGGFWCWNSSAVITRATFYGNEAPISGSGLWTNQANVELRNSIVASSVGGSTITCTTTQSEVTVKNCNFFANEDGDELPDCIIEKGGNFSLDPLFADPSGDNFCLQDSSPCAPGNHPDGIDAGWIGTTDGCRSDE